MRFKNRAIVVTALFAVVILLGAYAAGNRTGPRTTPQEITPQGQNSPNNFQQGQQGQLLQNRIPENNNQTRQGSEAIERQIADSQKKAETIKTSLEKLSEIEKANVIVVGNTAIVGCKISKEAKDINDTKNMVADRVKGLDKSIKNVAVSDSADIMSRINKLSSNITKSKDINEINNEVNKIIEKSKILVK